MKRLSVVVSDDAWRVLKRYQEKEKINTQDGALDALLLEYGKWGEGAELA